MLIGERDRGPLRFFVRGSGFDDSRHNGTPYQYNRTRLVRYATGADWKGIQRGSWRCGSMARMSAFRQTFSSISNCRNFRQSHPAPIAAARLPTKFSFVPDNELGAAAHWNQPLGAGLLLVAGADVHDVRVWDREQSLDRGRADQPARPSARLRPPTPRPCGCARNGR